MGINSVVFLPPTPVTYTSKVPRDIIWLHTSSGKRIPAYYFPAKRTFIDDPYDPDGETVDPALASRYKTTILYSHGNAADIGGMHEFLTLLHDNLPDINILHYEYIGYGMAKDQGDPNETTVFESVDAGLEHLLSVRGCSLTDIIIYGTSVGSGPTHHLIEKYQRFRGVVLESPFTSCCRVVVDRSVISAVLEKTIDIFVNIGKIPKVRCPVLVFHGTRDTVVPFEHGKKIWAAVPDDYKVEGHWVPVRGADHHDIHAVLGFREYFGIISDFLLYCQTFVETLDEAEGLAEAVSLSPSSGSSSRGGRRRRRRRGLFGSLFNASSSSHAGEPEMLNASELSQVEAENARSLHQDDFE